MGQYYRAITQEEHKKCKVYNRNVIRSGEEEYMVAKLTEHSWWYNEFVNAVCLDIYNSDKPNKVAWIGDYADTFLKCYDLNSFNGLSEKAIHNLTDRCWNCDGDAVEIPDFLLFDKFLINHDKKEYINCSDYYEKSLMKKTENGGWCLHPLPLLTCIGNGLGGGDYSYPTDDSAEELVGSWAWNKISIEDNAPIDSDYTEITPIFKEKGWD